MDIKQVYKNLCYYDDRNPNYHGPVDLDDKFRIKLYNKDECYCGNCFYGRTELAKYILTLLTHTNHETNH